MKSWSGMGCKCDWLCPEEWKDEAPEPTRRWEGRPESSPSAGCQSMGFMRSSNSFDFLNFHLRMTVQMMNVPPMEAAMTMMTVSAVRVILPAAFSGTAEVVEEAAA